jgi:intracellular sulfur oxidation DsrE/DsrF family protein
MKCFIRSLIAGLFAITAVGSGAALAEDAKQKVAYHVNYDDPKHQAAALRNVQNHINAVGADKLDLKVVLHGDGLALLLYPDAKDHTKMKMANADDEMQARVAGLKQQGVQFQICANTLKGRKINADDDLYDVSQADIVPSGVAQLGILQAQGYAYIKP